jgi:arginyl-tRNA synthetase
MTSRGPRRRIEDAFGRAVLDRFGTKIDISLSEPKEEFGDYACPAPFALAKELKRNPNQISVELCEALSDELEDLVDSLTPAGGFVNVRLKAEALQGIVDSVLEDPESYGKSDIGEGERINVEFVSANPTGPLTVPNARAAATGDTLVRTLNECGYRAGSEFYSNDAGGQFDRLQRSVEARVKEARGEPFELPEDGYPGRYLVPIAQELVQKGIEETKWARQAVETLLGQQMDTLKRFRVTFDEVVKESWVRASEYVEKLRPALKSRVYEQDGALYLKSTDLGDERDRVVIRSGGGGGTYLFFDLAYHLYKFDRGFERFIDILGPDHQGHVPSMKAGMEALGLGQDRLEVIIVQQVNLIRGGERVKMSKRAGEFYTMDELMDEVGVDAARFFFNMRSAPAHMDFDLDLAKKLGNENPVFYVQYLHARTCSLETFGKEQGVTIDDPDLSLLTLPEERSVMRKLLYFPDVLESVARRREPHHIPMYLLDLANIFHNYYQAHRIITEDKPVSKARLALCKAVGSVVGKGLDLLGVEAPERM